MPSYRDDAIVLRTHKLGEADRILTLLTRQHGKVRAVAKGVRRTSSKFGARLEPFMIVDAQFFIGRSLDIVQQADSIGAYGAEIAADFDRFTAANAMAETAERVSETDATEQQFVLLHGALRALARGEHATPAILSSFLLRMLAVSGWAITLDACARCGSPDEVAAFSPELGGTVCDRCAPPGTPRITAASQRVLQALLAGDWAVVDAAAPPALGAASAFVVAFTQTHVERAVRSLNHLVPVT